MPKSGVRWGSPDGGGADASSATLTGLRAGTAVVTLTYQRRLASGRYVDVVNRRGAHSEPVGQAVRIVVPGRPA